MERKVRFLVNLAYFGSLAALIALSVYFLMPVLLPFLLGFLVAAACNPVITKLSRFRKRGFCTFFIIVPFWGILLFLLWKAGVLLYGEAAELLQWIRDGNLNTLFDGVEIPFFGESAQQWLARRAEDWFPALVDLFQSALMRLLDVLMALPNALIFSFTVVASSFLFSLSFPKIEPFLLRQFSLRWQTEYFDLKEFLVRKILRIFRAYAIMLAINYGELLLGFFVLKVPYPMIFAAFIAVFDLLPYVGIPSVLIPWGLAEWFLFSDVSLGIGLIVLAVIIFLCREIVEPRIVGKTIGLSALASLFGIYLGMKVMGFFGVILFPLLFLLLKEWNDSGRFLLWKSEPDDS